MDKKISFIENNKVVKYEGYAFLDNDNRCVIIVYGKTKMNLIKKMLNMPL